MYEVVWSCRGKGLPTWIMKGLEEEREKEEEEQEVEREEKPGRKRLLHVFKKGYTSDKLRGGVCQKKKRSTLDVQQEAGGGRGQKREIQEYVY